MAQSTELSAEKLRHREFWRDTVLKVGIVIAAVFVFVRFDSTLKSIEIETKSIEIETRKANRDLAQVELDAATCENLVVTSELSRLADWPLGRIDFGLNIIITNRGSCPSQIAAVATVVDYCELQDSHPLAGYPNGDESTHGDEPPPKTVPLGLVLQDGIDGLVWTSIEGTYARRELDKILAPGQSYDGHFQFHVAFPKSEKPIWYRFRSFLLAENGDIREVYDWIVPSEDVFTPETEDPTQSQPGSGDETNG